MSGNLLKLADAAKYLSIQPRKLKKLMEDGMPHLHIPDCGIRIDLDKAIAWLVEQKEKADREKAYLIQGIRLDLKARKKALRSFISHGKV